MPWNKIVTSDSVIQRLYEDKGIYQETNRSYDSLVEKGATSVTRPKLATVTAKKNEGTAAGDAARKNTKDDTVMVTTDLDVYTVPIYSAVAAKFESNDMLRRQYEISMALALKRLINKEVIAAAQATSNVVNAGGANLAFDDYVGILEFFESHEVPEENRIIVTPAGLMKQFYAIPTIATAVGFNKELLQQGMSNQMLGARWYVSGLVPTLGGKQNIVAWYSQGLAFILSNEGEIMETYDPGVDGTRKPGQVIDMLAHGAAELDDDVFAYVVKSL